MGARTAGDDRPHGPERDVDDIGKLIGGGTGGGGLAGAFGDLVGGEGGLEGLVNQLGNAGLGDVVGSWVSTGPNKAVDPARLGDALGAEKVQQLAGKTGLSAETLLPVVASALPAIVDALTPDGKVPAGDAASGLDIGGLLEGLSEAAKAGPGSPLASIGDLLGGPKG
jgi:uncharacterized protein YidB (DUF937 family)